MAAQTAPIPTYRETFRYLGRILLLIRKYWGGLGKGLLLGMLVGMTGLVTPYITKLYVDDVFPARDVGLMNVLVAGMLVFTVASSLMGAIRGYFTQTINAQLSRAVSLMYFNHLQHLPIRFFDQHRVGEVMSRFGDVRGSLNALTGVLQTVIVNGTFLVIVPPLLFAMNWKLALLALCTTPITSVISLVTARYLRRWWKHAAEVAAELSAYQMEVLSQIRTLKSIGAEDHVYRRTADQMDEALHVQLRTAGASTVIGLVNGFFRALGGALFTWYAWTAIIRGELTLGGFLAFSAYLGYLTGPVGQMTGLFAGFQKMSVTLGRAFEYLDLPTEQDPAAAFTPFPKLTRVLRGDIEFNGVTFSYEQGRPILRELSARIPEGSVCAVVGPSGAGKSTLLRLLSRFDEPETGFITVGGERLQRFTLPDLRRQVAVVWQDFPLLRGTLWDNLTLGFKEAQDDAVMEALIACQLESFIRELPDGLRTPVAEWGATVSGGQRQRLAIARALVRRTPLLLLDEVTSQLDVPTEAELMRSVLGFVEHRTVVIVTHRVSTAALTDGVLVIEAGRLTGSGSHRDLASSHDWYREMAGALTIPAEPRLRVVAGQTA
jgi:ABC-type bacteriocin/lantibiotic exporter with double-glycine peptidase domain